MNVKKIVTDIVQRLVGEIKSEENIQKINNDIVDPIIRYTVNTKLRSIINIIYFYIVILTAIIVIILAIVSIHLFLFIRGKSI